MTKPVQEVRLILGAISPPQQGVRSVGRDDLADMMPGGGNRAPQTSCLCQGKIETEKAVASPTGIGCLTPPIAFYEIR